MIKTFLQTFFICGPNRTGFRLVLFCFKSVSNTYCNLLQFLYRPKTSSYRPYSSLYRLRLLSTVPRLFGTVPVIRQCPKTLVLRVLSQGYCPKASVPRLVSQDHCPKASVPRLVSQDYCPKASVPRLLSQG